MYRSHFALRDTVRAQDGTNVGACYGYLGMVTRLIVTRRPDDVVHVYDHDWRPIARTDLFPGYKSTRPPDPEGLPGQFEILRELLDLTGMRQAETEGWEAEDAIGALCAEATDDDRVEIVSGDRDLIQLVRDPVVTLLFTVRGVSELHTFDEAAVLEKYGVPASRYVEFAILRGDPSDELPGVKGVGEKTARDLVVAFDSIEAMLAAAAAGDLAIKPAIRQRLLESASYLADMQRLVPVNGDAPLEIWAGERDDAALTELGERYAIRGPVQRILAALDAAAR
jgi:5'-3' exonuclease